MKPPKKPTPPSLATSSPAPAADAGAARLQLFLKAPHPGSVKTRLAQSTGDAPAAALYRQLVEAQLQRLPADTRAEIHYHPAEAGAEMLDWLGAQYSYHPQVAGSLGQKLESAVAAAFASGARAVLCLGGDCPALGAAEILQAQRALEHGADVVFGPTEDGGYYLIGLRQPQPELFRDIPWSASNTLEASRQKATALGLRVELLPMLYDVDELSDLERARREGRLPPA